jgi:hypothetical protein
VGVSEMGRSRSGASPSWAWMIDTTQVYDLEGSFLLASHILCPESLDLRPMPKSRGQCLETRGLWAGSGIGLSLPMLSGQGVS